MPNHSIDRLSNDECREEFRRMIKASGMNNTEFAALHKLHRSRMSEVLGGKRHVMAKMAALVGYRRVLEKRVYKYVRIK